MKLSLPSIPCIIRDDLTDEQTAAYRIADNKTAELAEWDREKLKHELSAIGCSIDMGLFGFDVPKIDDLTEQEENAEQQETETITKPGCIWHLGKHRLMCGSSTDEKDVKRLMNGEIAALCVTDPPYNVAYEGASTKEKIANDDMGEGFQAFLLDAMKRAVENTRGPFFGFIGSSELHTMHKAFVMAGGHFGFWGLWTKTHFTLSRSDYQRKFEPYLYGWIGENRPESPRKMSDVFTYSKPAKSALHPTMKPVQLFEEIIKKNSRKGDIVLDLFGGSGTTIIASEKQHRVGFSMELSPIFCDRIVERFRADFCENIYMEEPKK